MAVSSPPRTKVIARDDLPGLPGALTPVQQLAAIQRVQALADQRLKLGAQLFKAAEGQATRQQQMLEQLKADQAQLRDQMISDVAKSLQTYDQWIAQVEDRVTGPVQALEVKLDEVTRRVAASEQKLEQMMSRAEALFDQVRCVLDAIDSRPPRAPGRPGR